MRLIAIAFVLLCYPVFAAWLRANPRHRYWAYFGIGLLPFTVTAWNLDAALVNWATWPGYAKGLIITVEDALALAIITTHRKPRGLPPLSGYVIAYMLAVLLSASMSSVPVSALFYLFQLLRMLAVMTAVTKIVQVPGGLTWVARGLAAGMIYEACVCILQRAEGAFQASGTMGHQNMLGLMAHFVLLPLLAMLLGGVRSRMLMLGVLSTLVVLALGASRGSIGFALMGAALLVAFSLARRSTAHKWKIVGFAALALLVTSPFVLEGMYKRLQQVERSTGDERSAFERAAKAIIADHPMGVGANQYVIVANNQGYSQRAGVIWQSGSRSANVHNTYLLVAAETGWIGLLSFVGVFVAAIVTGLTFAFRNRRDPRGDVVLGATVAVIAVAGHNFYEWVWVTYQAQYVFGISLGIIAGLVRARAFERRSQQHSQGYVGGVTPAGDSSPTAASGVPTSADLENRPLVREPDEA